MSVEARINTNKKALVPDIFGFRATERAVTPPVRTSELATPKPHEAHTQRLNNIFRTMITNRERRDESTPPERQQELTRSLEAQYNKTGDSTVHEVFPVLVDLAAEQQNALDLAKEDKASGAQEKRKSGFLDPFGRISNDIFIRAFEDRTKGAETPVMRLAQSALRLNDLNLKLRTHSYRSPEDANDAMVAEARMQDLATAYKQEGEPKPYAAAAAAMEKIQANNSRK